MRADYEDDGSLLQSVANYGLQMDQVAARGPGEYNGLAIRPARAPILPLITDERVDRALDFLEREKPIEASRVMQLQLREDFSQLYYALARWLRKALNIRPEEFEREAAKYRAKTKPAALKEFDEWLLTTSSDPIRDEIEIVDAGRSDEARGPVVPEDWTGRRFASGRALHQAMDRLEWRRGRPPVSYCCCYFMRIRREGEWGHEVPKRVTLGIRVRLNGAALVSEVKESPNAAWFRGFECMTYQHFAYDRVEHITVACHASELFEPTPRYIKRENAGVLVTRMQKCNRRGRGCARLIDRTVRELVETRPYNLPDQQMLRVSGSKQAAWRLFVTTIEDSEPWAGRIPGGLSMLDLAALALLANSDPGRQWNKRITDFLAHTAVAVQRHDGPGQMQTWARVAVTPSKLRLQGEPERDAFRTLLRTMPMSGGDRHMLESAMDMAEFRTLGWHNGRFADRFKDVYPQLEQRTILASYDMISSPHLLIMMQACLGATMTLPEISGRIWDESSGANIRRLGDAKKLMPTDAWTRTLLACQKWLYNRTHLDKSKLLSVTGLKTKRSALRLTEQQSRVVFLLAFGREHRFRYAPTKDAQTYDVAVCGTSAAPLKVRHAGADQSEFIEGALRDEIERSWREQFDMQVTLPIAPAGWRWLKRFGESATPRVRLRAFSVNNLSIQPFDGSALLEAIDEAVPVAPRGTVAALLEEAAEPACSLETILKLRDSKETDKSATLALDRLAPEFGCLDRDQALLVWRIIRVKFRTLEADGLLQCGPVDPMGNKLQNFVHPRLEGVVWRAMSALCAAFPHTVRAASNLLNFEINRAGIDYVPLMAALERWSAAVKTAAVVLPARPPVLVTRLWPHQEKTRVHIIDGTLRLGKRGHGDASNVGAGKTLTALGVVQSLMAHNYAKRHTRNWAALIMVPTEKLYKTWRDQLEQHTRGFLIIEQQANGAMMDVTGKLVTGPVPWNGIVITTMGRAREHPPDTPWTVVVIDECLTIQNRNALQTGEAWRQVATAHYGCLLLSATFFRSRIDKLYFMLKMLQTGIPEERDFLTAILGECIVCNVPVKETRWTQNTTRVRLPPALRREYDRLAQMNLTSEKLFVVLSKFLYDRFDYPGAFREVLERLARKGKRVLIFARSREEADLLAEKLPATVRYPVLPEGQKRHVVGTVAECGYGVNDLVICDAILCRPQNPDVLPQLKGRIDRPGQTKRDLHLEYLLVEDTIEEANLVVLEMAARFRNKFIMPLAEFYDIAVRRKK
jgi:hypothetical protein